MRWEGSRVVYKNFFTMRTFLKLFRSCSWTYFEGGSHFSMEGLKYFQSDTIFSRGIPT